MTALNTWWRERLIARRPVKDDRLWVPDVDYLPGKSDEHQWPVWVRVPSLLDDLFMWLERNPDAAPGREIALLMERGETEIRNLISQPGQGYQYRKFRVTRTVPYQGRWERVGRLESFIKLVEWERHALAFEQTTGEVLPFKIGAGDLEGAPVSVNIRKL